MSVKTMSLVFEYNMPDLKTEDGKTVPDSTAKFVLLALADHAGENGENAYIGVRRMCRKTSLSSSTVCNALSALRAGGYIQLVGKGPRDTNNYTINLEAFQPPKHPDSSHRNGGVLATETEPSLTIQEHMPTKKKDGVDWELEKVLPAMRLRAAVEKFFPFNVRWETKTAREWLEWAHGENITAEQIEQAANRWKNDKKFNWQQPNLQRIFENWPALMFAEYVEQRPEWRPYVEEEKHAVPNPGPRPNIAKPG